METEVQVVELKNDQFQQLLVQLNTLQKQNDLQMEALNMLGHTVAYQTAIVGILTILLAIAVGIYIIRS